MWPRLPGSASCCTCVEWTTTAYCTYIRTCQLQCAILLMLFLLLQTSRRMFCISDILQSGKATKYINDPQCRQLATVFHTQGFYSPWNSSFYSSHHCWIYTYLGQGRQRKFVHDWSNIDCFLWNVCSLSEGIVQYNFILPIQFYTLLRLCLLILQHTLYVRTYVHVLYPVQHFRECLSTSYDFV